MNDFKKYPSIENSYRGKYVKYWLDRYPELIDVVYAIEEKIHGANIQLLFTPNKPMRVGKRSCYISENSSFFNIWETLRQYESAIEFFQRYVGENKETIRLYGEIFGPGIQKGIYYGDHKQIRFFGMRVDGEWFAPKDFYDFFISNKIESLLVPRLGWAEGLEEALNFEHIFQSTIVKTEGDNFAEGVVIKPYSRVYVGSTGSIFSLKHKNEEFSNKAVGKTKTIIDPTISLLQLTFRRYVNENRVASVFSKEGAIERPTQMGQYIKLVLNDAKEDFLKDHPEVLSMSRKAQGQVFKAGHLVVPMLKEYL